MREWKITKAVPGEIGQLMEIYAAARRFMRQTGNAAQWTGGYPSAGLLLKDIAECNLYTCRDEDDSICAGFFFSTDPDPTYEVIYDGQWMDTDMPYGVVHRLASSGKVKGAGAFCMEWCFEMCGNIRVDTHRDNIVMQNMLGKLGYKKCGIIYLTSGDERIAYQKTGYFHK